MSTFEFSPSLFAAPNTSHTPEARPLGELRSNMKQLLVFHELILVISANQSIPVHLQEHIYKYSLYNNFSTDEDDLYMIVSELRDVTEVLKLGLALGIRKSALDKILQDSTNLEDRKIEVIHHWLTRRDIVRLKQGECPGWNALAVAIAEINPALSQRIQQRHC